VLECIQIQEIKEMSNNLERDLEVNEVIIVKLLPGYEDSGIDSRFVCKGGFGMKSYTSGRKIFGTWVNDGTDDFIGYGAIDVKKTNEYQEKFGKHGEKDPDYIKD
jgi:hypothetical protein